MCGSIEQHCIVDVEHVRYEVDAIIAVDIQQVSLAAAVHGFGKVSERR